MSIIVSGALDRVVCVVDGRAAGMHAADIVGAEAGEKLTFGDAAAARGVAA